MSWTPRHHHISQLQVDPATGALTGRNDCLEAALARYVFEATKLTTPWTSDDAAINLVSLAARGAADTPNNPDTTLPEAAAALAHWGLPVDWTTDFQTALNAPWALCLVDGTGLAPAQYPANWFPSAGQANHFLLWLPKWQGSTNWFNDPLAFANGQQDCQYDLNSMAGAFYGAYLLPSTGNGETPPLPWRNARGQSFG
ncbi:MAG TPA: hypothetical protein VNL71_02105, partial [Chloroflexota bacterium]|nr:hypothetical protein [Chloroflexota bacterium]